MNAINQPYRGEDITGKVFDNLHVVKMDGKNKHGHVLWLCKCSCGETAHKSAPHLRIKRIFQACDKCTAARLSASRAARQFKHGYTRTRTYISWQSMKQRCLNRNHASYENYGAVGVTISPEWIESFEALLSDMGERPAGMSIDRYPLCAGNYEPGNCRWATLSEQELNKRPYDRGGAKQRAAQRRMAAMKEAA